jgi:hypothetical protein
MAPFTATHIEALGAEASYGPKSRARASREVLLRLVVVHKDVKFLELFGRELGSIGIGFAPGITGIYNGRPKPTPQIRLFTLFIDKSLLAPPTVSMGDDRIEVAVPPGAQAPAPPPPSPVEAAPPPVDAGETVEVPLMRLAIIAREPAYLPTIRREVTPARMADHFRHLVAGEVQRFEAPGLGAFNFLLQGALGGGGMASLRIDPQGKAYGQMALEMMIPVPVALLKDAEA